MYTRLLLISTLLKRKYAQPPVSRKKYENDCLQNFLLLSISLLTALTVKNSHI